MVEAELISLISNLGFPIAISIYLLWTRDKTIDRNSQAIDDLSDVINQLCNKIK